jgi:peptide subunit release factor 1 (eRF1)
MATATLARSKRGIGPQLARLNAVRPGRHRVVSCYLKLEPRDRMRGKYLIKVKNRVRALEQALPALGLGREVEEAAHRDLGRVLTWLGRPGNLPASQGLAIFACGPLKLFEAVPLPRVHRSRLAVDRTTLVRELAAAEEEFGRVLTVVADRTAARFFEVTAFGARELDGLSAGATRGGKFRGDQDGPGWGEHSYHNRIREEKQRHWDAVARQLFALDRRDPAHGIVLAGTGNEARAITPFLHPYLVDRVMGSARLNPKESTAAEVHAAALTVRQEWERTSERLLLHEMEEGLGTGWAVNGMRATLRALGRGQVRTLLISPDAAEPGYRADGTGRIALAEADLRGDTDVHPVIDVVDDAIEEALRQGVTLNVIFEPAARKAVDGLAALLRFR